MKLTKSIKNKLTAVLATGVLVTSMVGCSSTNKEAELTDLTITHVTSPLNVPSIIQKDKNMISVEPKIHQQLDVDIVTSDGRNINDILEESLGFISNLIDGLGGLPGVLSLVSSWMLKAFGPDIAASMERIAYNINITKEERVS